MAFSLRLFGGAALEGERGSLTGPAVQRHRLALLALLATTRSRAVSREKLMASLWPERESEPARRLLNQSVHALRHELGADAILSVGEDLQLNPTIVRSDVAAFEEALARGDAKAAATLYSGPFLDGFFLDDAPDFERWVEGERDRLANARAKAIESLADAAERAGDSALAVDWWRERAAHDPYDSRVALRLMHAMDRAGNRAGALQHGATHQQLLRSELGLQEVPEVAALSERLRRSPMPAATAPRDPAPGHADVPSAAIPDRADSRDDGAPPDQRRRSLALLVVPVLVLLAIGGAVRLWPERSRSPGRVSAGVDEIAQAVARELDRRNRGDTSSHLARHRTTSIAAYELYLRGDDPALLRSDSGARLGVEYFRRAIALDSNYAAAWTGLARLSYRASGSNPRVRAAARRESEAAVRRALALDDSLAEAHSLMGVMRTQVFAYDEAERHFRRAIELEPGDPRNHERLASFFLQTGQRAEALAAANRAMEIDPLSPSANAELGRALLANDRCEEAIERVRPLIALDPPLLRAFPLMAQCLGRLGRYQEAITLLESTSREPTPLFGYMLARAGRRSDALDVQASLRREYERDSIGAYQLAFVPAALGDKDEAFKWLEIAVEDGSLGFLPGLTAGFFGPPFDDLQDDPRIERLRQRMGLQKR